MARMCLLTEQEVKGDGEDEPETWNVTGWRNENILKVEQAEVGMVFKWKVVKSISETLRGGQPSTWKAASVKQGKKVPEHRLPPRLGMEI